ncbi:putative ubiquitin-conjugating enzyme E2 24 [Camellia lanceoleosa]|uniref:Ubiquitin-conjugating enzyme E2 24 n=1 Tax=Camellia lanceoleosa TaxID=1840588 RepID=A0ACC0GIS5_9ERIC|nr:putative ubiquitin-conjugating enzyme E2 24 [Camellia lanceoleosa]
MISFHLRGFIQGDIVCSATDPSGQMGRVVNVDMFVDLENLDGKKIKNVNSRKIRRIRSVSVGDYVVHGPWLGRVDKIVDSVTILFDDGTKSELTTMGPEKLVPLSPDLLEDSQYPYYPGQRVRVELHTVSKSARWLCGTWKEKRDEGTICAVEAGFLYVDWLACALLGSEKAPAPPCMQDSKNLTFLSYFSHANWQLGDWCMLPTADCKGVMDQIFLGASTFDLCKGHKQAEKVFQEIFVIVKTKTNVDVLWQDGSYSTGIDSPSLCPVNIVDAHDFWVDQFVLEKGTSDDPHVHGAQRWGVIEEETVSAYELVEHPDYSYCPGDVVFQWEKNQLVDEEADLKVKNCGGEQNVFLNNDYLSCIGIVMGFKDGNVEVKWASGHITKVAPYEIFRMDKYEGSSPNLVPHGENAEQLTQEMTRYDEQPLHPKEKVLLDIGSHFLPQAAIEIFTSIVGSLFGSVGSTSRSGTSDLALEERHGVVSNSEEDLPESCNLCTEDPPVVVDDVKTFGQTNLGQKVKATEEESPFILIGLQCQQRITIISGEKRLVEKGPARMEHSGERSSCILRHSWKNTSASALKIFCWLVRHIWKEFQLAVLLDTEKVSKKINMGILWGSRSCFPSSTLSLWKHLPTRVSIAANILILEFECDPVDINNEDDEINNRKSSPTSCLITMVRWFSAEDQDGNDTF